MAKLSANGTEIGRVDWLSYSLSFRSNGKILVNTGDGWKVRSTAEQRNEISAEDCFREEMRTFESYPPEFHNFRQKFHALFPLKSRAAANLLFLEAAGNWTHEKLYYELRDGVRKTIDREAVSSAYWAFLDWLHARESMTFAILCGNTIAAMVRGCADFRRQVLNRVKQSQILERRTFERVRERLARPAEIRLFTACGNTVETIETHAEEFRRRQSQTVR